MRYYPGNPIENTSGVAFSEAVSIWAGPGCDWKAAIASIKPDPQAGRASRETDPIPLRDEQLLTYNDEYHDAVDMQRDGLWEWEFVEIGEQLLAPIPAEDTAEDVTYFNRCTPIMGRKSQELIPAIIKLMRDQEPFGSWSSANSHRTSFRCGGSELHLGRPRLSIRFFDYSPWVRQLILIPHISARGPNGAWIIRRGPNHPDTQALANRHAYFLGSPGSPETVVYRDQNKIWPTEILELFSTHEEAKEFAAMLDEGNDAPDTEIGRAEGLDLISLFALVDVVEIGDHQFAITHAGASYFEQDKATMSEIAATLPLAINPALVPSTWPLLA